MADQHDPTSTLDLFRLDGLTAIVTGASSGLGDRFARVLHAVGANVVVTACRAERLERLAGDLNGRRPGAASALVVVADVGIEADRERIVSASSRSNRTPP